MAEKELIINIDWAAVDELAKAVEETAHTICAEQPDVPQATNLRDLDSFSMVQVLLELENNLDMKLLENMERFEGESYRDLAEFIVRLAYEAEAEAEAAAADGQAQPAADRPA